MLKRILAAFAVVMLACSPVLPAGTISLGGTQQFSATGSPLIDCKLYFYVTGTTTPQDSYSNSGLTTANPWPLSCDSSGRIPFFYLADGTIKIRLTDSGGTTILTEDGLVVVGPSSGEGGGSEVDATTIYQTGDLKVRYGTGTHTGWVRANGRTIGSASSGATERANADTQTLFEYLWDADANLAVSGGRGASANADWAANKTITLPDYRGAAIAGLGDMGNSATSVLTSTYCGADPTVLGQACGAQSTTFTQANLPSVNFTVSIGAGQGSHSHAFTGTVGSTSSAAVSGAGITAVVGPQVISTSPATLPSMSGTAASGGSGTPFSRVQPSLLATIYLKL